MSSTPTSSARQDAEGEVWNAIAMFEQLVEVMPDDRTSLEALAQAYEQVGDRARAREYQIRLARLLVTDGQFADAGPALERIRQYADDPQAREVLELAEQLRQAQDAAAAETTADAATPGKPAEKNATPALSEADLAAKSTFNVAEEMALAWNLLQATEFTQEEYARVVQDLTELSAGNAGTVSVLHVLQARASPKLERTMVAMARRYDTPIIALGGFEIRPESGLLLPLTFMVRRGAVVFDQVGKDPLVVVMNPADKPLRRDVAAITRHTCHFFLAQPAEFDAAMEKIRQMKSEDA